MNLAPFLDSLQKSISRSLFDHDGGDGKGDGEGDGENSIQKCITGHYSIPSKGANYVSFPLELSPQLQKGLMEKGIRSLYKHQGDAFTKVFIEKKNIVCVIPTNSGKSLTYLLPIFQHKIANPKSRTLLFYPTKALSQDQQLAINHLSKTSQLNLSIATFDEDTAPNLRKRIREAGDFVITNMDMLHSGILPQHTSWTKFFENIDFIVIDELHSYRGIFGSHVANVLRRLLRICHFYGSDPQILACSATIANPIEHAKKLTTKDFELIDKDGAPHSQKNIIFYNPPLEQIEQIEKNEFNIRASGLGEAVKLGERLLKNKISTIFFCKSRLRVELLTNALKERCVAIQNQICSYRGGYLPSERREIEKELCTGKLLAIVSTNALELGIDTSTLDVSISVGHTGSVGSLLEQFGRVGRNTRTSFSILIANSSGADQYIIQNPKYFLERHSEHAVCNPENLFILTDHIKCAAFELPFSQEETFYGSVHTQEILDYLTNERILYNKGNKYHWHVEDIYPASRFSLRSGPRENFMIIDITQDTKEEVIGETNLFSAPVQLHEGAIYIHQGRQYYVEEFLWEDRQARVRQINIDYYTDAEEKLEIAILENIPTHSKKNENQLKFFQGELAIRVKAVIFKKLKINTDENLGWGEINTPEIEMHTQAAWLLVTPQHHVYQKLSPSQVGELLYGVAYSLSIVAPLFVLCDPKDIRIRAEVRTKTFRLPAIYCYDNSPGGMELATRIFQQIHQVATSAADLIKKCPCKKGCPSCVGPPKKEISLKKWCFIFLESLGTNEKEERHIALQQKIQ